MSDDKPAPSKRCCDICRLSDHLQEPCGCPCHAAPAPAPAPSERDEVERYNCVKFHRDECGDDCSCACHAPAPEGAAVLTREELKRLTFLWVAWQEERTVLLAHDVALRAEVERLRNLYGAPLALAAQRDAVLKAMREIVECLSRWDTQVTEAKRIAAAAIKEAGE